MSKHGCCADKECNPSTCMDLPTGKTCGHCVHERRCCTIFGHEPSDTYCDWFPRRFQEKPAPAMADQPSTCAEWRGSNPMGKGD